MLISEQVRLANVVSAKAQVRKIASELEQTSVGEKIAKKQRKIASELEQTSVGEKTAKNRERIRTNFSRRKNSEKSRAN
jgi:hypothetical protein